MAMAIRMMLSKGRLGESIGSCGTAPATRRGDLLPRVAAWIIADPVARVVQAKAVPLLLSAVRTMSGRRAFHFSGRFNHARRKGLFRSRSHAAPRCRTSALVLRKRHATAQIPDRR